MYMRNRILPTLTAIVAAAAIGCTDPEPPELKTTKVILTEVSFPGWTASVSEISYLKGLTDRTYATITDRVDPCQEFSTITAEYIYGNSVVPLTVRAIDGSVLAGRDYLGEEMGDTAWIDRADRMISLAIGEAARSE